MREIREIGDEIYERIDSDFDSWLKEAGYESEGEFMIRTGYCFDDLKGKFFTLAHDRIFFLEDEE